MTKRLLIVYAHPDDESFGLGALIAKYVADGVEVYLICATNGDVGTVAPEFMAGYSSVSEVRLAELACASQVLGFKEVITFGYRDSGMMNTPDNDNPQSLWQASLDAVADQIIEVIHRVQPQVVITFDPFGGYGHPDHIKCHLATHAAFDKMQGDPARPAKLYYHAFPRLMLRIGVFMMRLRGQDPRHVGTNHDMDLQGILDAVQPTHTRIYVGSYYDIGRKAAACHASQLGGGPRGGLLSSELIERSMGAYTTFTRVIPAPKSGNPIEVDLFSGIRDPVEA